MKWQNMIKLFYTTIFIYLLLICSVFKITSVNANQLSDKTDYDLEDFEFDVTPKNIANSKSNKITDDYNKSFEIDELFGFDDDNNESKDNENLTKNGFSNAINMKEKVIRHALSKALTNKVMRQKFIEVLPILRVLSTQQRLALAALISAQVNAKPGAELKLDQVNNMFGDGRKLIIPIVFDVANLIRTAVKNSFLYQHNILESSKTHPVQQKFYLTKPNNQNRLQQMQQTISRRNFDEVSDSNDNVPDEIIDAKQINDELYYTTRKGRILKIVPKQVENQKFKIHNHKKRSVSLSSFTSQSSDVEKQELNSIQKQSSNIADRTLHERKLNISGYENENDHLLIEPFKAPNDKSTFSINYLNSIENTTNIPYERVEDLAFSDINGTELKINHDIPSNHTNIEALPVPESLISSRNRFKGKPGHGPLPLHRRPLPIQHRFNGNGNRIDGRFRKPLSSALKGNKFVAKCERFTSSMCIHVDDYPMDQIMGSIRRHKHAMSALLAEYRDKTSELEYQEYLDNLDLNKKRREDGGVTPGGMCSTIVRYARPQKARSATGEWKYIVNTGQHTQTLRLEKCSNPQDSCSYLSDNFKSRCLQVYNYHRLLSWDKTRGLHVDIFKVPTCCSCHVDGYRETFPPLTNSQSFSKLNEFAANSPFKNNHYSTISEEDDVDGEEEEDDDSGEDSIAYQFSNGFKRVKPTDLYHSTTNLKSRLDNIKTKIIPTIGTYLSPPAGSFDLQSTYKRGLTNTNSGNNNNKNNQKNSSSSNRSRRPSISDYLETDDRSDQIVAGTDIGKEVTVFPSNAKPTMRSKRIKYINNSVSTLAPTKPISTFSSTPSSTTYSTKITANTKTFLNTKLTNSNSAKGDASKRINYNYHPIIDFFDERSSVLATSTSLPPSVPASGRKLKKGITEEGIVTFDSGSGFRTDTNDWKPLIVME